MENFPSQEMDEKQKRWQDVADRVERVVDKLGKHIDANIKEIVIAFNALGINTTASCGGHIDHGTNSPYIDIETAEIAQLEKMLEDAKLDEEKESLKKEIKQKNLEERRKIFPYLDAFYKKRKTPFHQRLVVQGLARGWSRLESQGVDFQAIESEEIKQENLIAFQNEMKDFSLFMRGKFFEGQTVEKKNLMFLDFEEQIKLHASQWSPEFKALVEQRAREKDRLDSEVYENEQVATYYRYLRGLDLKENDLKGKSILDLGTGDGEFVRECLDKNLTSSIYGFDAQLNTSELEEKYKSHLFQGDFQEKFPKQNMDYVVSVGAVSEGVWGGEITMDMEKILQNALDTVKDGGEIRIFPIQEAARETPLEGLEESEKRWNKILDKFSKETGADISLRPVGIKVVGKNNDIILEKVLIIKKPVNANNHP